MTHNWHWLWATREELVDVPAGNYGTRLNTLLQEYSDELGGEDTGVPRSIITSATPLVDAAAAEAAPGPAEAASEETVFDSASAALIDASPSTSLALQQVQHIIREHQEIMLLDRQAAKDNNEEEELTCVQLELTSLEKVRAALETLTSQKLRDELAQELEDHSKDGQVPVLVAKLQCGTNYLKEQ